MPKTKKIPSIEEATDIIVEIAAEGVVDQAKRLLGHEYFLRCCSDVTAVGYLTGHSEATYQANPRFRAKVNSNADHGNRGRDYLWSFMQHWLSAYLLKVTHNAPELRRALEESGFSTGRYTG